MKSHTVPKRLLEQFSYFSPVTNSLRLWRYEKGRKPFGKASPSSATAVPSYFASARDTALEDEIERRLANEVENPVHAFLPHFADPLFRMNPKQIEQMTRYVWVLFNRSQARRDGNVNLREISTRALEGLLEDDAKLSTLAVHWNLKALFSGVDLRRFGRLMTNDDVRKAILKIAEREREKQTQQERFVELILRSLTRFDQTVHSGEWRILRTAHDNPFIISDAPVVTWERMENGEMTHGVGFHRPNVEVLLPISPTTCLHILPAVVRTRETATPTTEEVNVVQARFAYSACFADRNSESIDGLVQEHISTLKMAKNAFVVPNVDYNDALYEQLFRS